MSTFDHCLVVRHTCACTPSSPLDRPSTAAACCSATMSRSNTSKQSAVSVAFSGRTTHLWGREFGRQWVSDEQANVSVT